MARYQLISSLLLLVILVAHSTAEAPRRLRFNRQRQFARQEVQPTPYPSAAELKPEQPVLIYGPPPATDVDELPEEQELPENSFQPEAAAEEIDVDEDFEEPTTQAAPARLRLSPKRLAKLQQAKAQPKRQRSARLEELAVEAPAPAVTPAAALPVPQFYYVNAQQPFVGAQQPLVVAQQPLVGAQQTLLGAQQPYVFAYNTAAQQLAW